MDPHDLYRRLREVLEPLSDAVVALRALSRMMKEEYPFMSPRAQHEHAATLSIIVEGVNSYVADLDLLLELLRPPEDESAQVEPIN